MFKVKLIFGYRPKHYGSVVSMLSVSVCVALKLQSCIIGLVKFRFLSLVFIYKFSRSCRGLHRTLNADYITLQDYTL